MSYLYNILDIFFLSFYCSMNEATGISAIEQHVIDFVIKIRVKNKLKQEDIANIIGVGRTFITNVENLENRAKYNLTHIDKLADYFALSPQAFLPRESLVSNK